MQRIIVRNMLSWISCMQIISHGVRKSTSVPSILIVCSTVPQDAMQFFVEMKILEWNGRREGEGDWSSGHCYPNRQGVGSNLLGNKTLGTSDRTWNRERN